MKKMSAFAYNTRLNEMMVRYGCKTRLELANKQREAFLVMLSQDVGRLSIKNRQHVWEAVCRFQFRLMWMVRVQHFAHSIHPKLGEKAQHICAKSWLMKPFQHLLKTDEMKRLFNLYSSL